MIVLGYLSRYGSIGRTTAANHFDIYDLPNVIFRLRKRGHNIESEGFGKHLKYTIPKEAEKYRSKPQEKEIVTT